MYWEAGIRLRDSLLIFASRLLTLLSTLASIRHGCVPLTLAAPKVLTSLLPWHSEPFLDTIFSYPLRTAGLSSVFLPRTFVGKVLIPLTGAEFAAVSTIRSPYLVAATHPGPAWDRVLLFRCCIIVVSNIDSQLSLRMSERIFQRSPMYRASLSHVYSSYE